MHRIRYSNCAALIALLLFCHALRAWSGSIDPELQRAMATGARNFPVIVRMVEQVNGGELRASMGNTGRKERIGKVVSELRGRALKSQESISSFLETKKKAGKVKDIRPFWIFNGVALRATGDSIRELAARSDVAEVTPDCVRTLATPQPASAVAWKWNLDWINVNYLWDKGFKGGGEVIAVLDTGVDINHPDLTGSWRGGTNSWFDPYSSSRVPYDALGHGTASTGVITGGSSSGVPIGVAPEAKWIAAKIFANDGTTSDSIIHAALQWALNPSGDPDVGDAPDVVNCSWTLTSKTATGEPQLPLYSEVFRPDIQILRVAGISVVFAAGNSGPLPNTSSSPANYPEAFSVGAIDSTALVADFSSRGPSAAPVYAFTSVGLPVDLTYPLVTAPGVGVVTAWLTQDGLYPDSYVAMSGTSIAAPQVAGAVALLQSAIPGVTAAQVEGALKNSVVGNEGPNNDNGYGTIDVAKAYDYLSIPGDVNGDGVVDVTDALIVMRVIAGLMPETGLIIRNGNVSPLVTGVQKSGITLQDALLVLQKAIGIISY